MKIAIIGYSGSGKSTLAKQLGNYYNIPVLHLDTVNFLPNWVERDYNDGLEIVKEFLQSNDNWVIDGNYHKYMHNERMELADKIIFMNFPRFTAYKQARRRAINYKGKQREDVAIGCNERFNLSFRMWILFTGRTKKRKKDYQRVIDTYPEKIVILKNKDEVKKYLNDLTGE